MKKINNTKLEVGEVIELKKYRDNRGFFLEVFQKKKFKDLNLNNKFLQINHSLSLKKNTIRGMHFQHKPFSQGKLIYVTSGSILDVFIDLRKQKESFGKVNKIKLSSKKPKLLYVPEYCAHGFCTLEDNTSVIYFTTNFYNKDTEETIKYNDRDLKITWPDLNCKVKLSRKDLNGKKFFDIIY